MAKVTKKTTAPAEVKAAPKAEVKVEAPKAAAAPVAEVKAAPKAEAPKAAAPKAEAKPAAKKPAAKKPAAKKAAPAKKEETKAAAKPAAKKAAKPATKKAPAKKAAPKKKEITVEDVAAKLAKKLDAKKAKSIDGKVAADIKLYGAFEAHMYIEVKDGKLTVAPYDYIEKDIEAAIAVENALAIIDGKLTIADALADGRLYAFGNIGAAAKLAKLF
ncbi:MAG: SCP2 sterol-binding domain-containing protein [Oscillospiraceae bacterium]|nr:SCP2 sterol-binding domain-containing protein [Oscillospiraceae bacterium]